MSKSFNNVLHAKIVLKTCLYNIYIHIYTYIYILYIYIIYIYIYILYIYIYYIYKAYKHNVTPLPT